MLHYLFDDTFSGCIVGEKKGYLEALQSLWEVFPSKGSTLGVTFGEIEKIMREQLEAFLASPDSGSLNQVNAAKAQVIIAVFNKYHATAYTFITLSVIILFNLMNTNNLTIFLIFT